MSTIINKVGHTRLNLNAADMLTANKEQMALDYLRQYENTCFDGSYVVRITSVMCGFREFMGRKMNGEGTMPVIFTYDAEVISDEDGCIIHNCVVEKVMETPQNHVVLTCISGMNIYMSVVVKIPGIIIPGMIIPVRCFNSSYPQNVENKINVFGEVIQPQRFIIELAVLTPTENELNAAQLMIDEVDKIAASVTEKRRSQYFKSWLYPHKQIDGGNENIHTTLKKKWAKITYIMINEWCDQTAMEYKKIKGSPAFNTITFTQFIETITSEAKKMWHDIKMLCDTYESDDVFKKHATIFKYYENAKDVDEEADIYDNVEQPVVEDESLT